MKTLEAYRLYDVIILAIGHQLPQALPWNSVKLILAETLMGNGAGCRSRTRDPLITNQVLYQLS